MKALVKLTMALLFLTIGTATGAGERQGYRVAQAVGYSCETPRGVCPLAYPLPVASACTCPSTSGPIAGKVK